MNPTDLVDQLSLRDDDETMGVAATVMCIWLTTSRTSRCRSSTTYLRW